MGYGISHGFQAILSYKAGLYTGGGAYAQAKNVGDVKLPLEFEDEILKVRAMGGFSAHEPGLCDMSIEFEILADNNDVAVAAFRTASQARGSAAIIALKALDVEGYGWEIDCKIFKFEKDEPISETNKYSVIARPCISPNLPHFIIGTNL